jgi:hypothetical protein
MVFAVYMPVGPGDDEVACAADVIDSVGAYSEHLRWVILVDDGSPPRDLAALCAVPPGTRVVVLKNPRDGIGPGRTGGLCVADLVAFDYLQRHTIADYVLKLDTDSLVIGPFERQVEQILMARPDAGMLGVMGDSFGENRGHRTTRYNRMLLENTLVMPDSYRELRPEHVVNVVPLPAGYLDEALYRRFIQAREVIARASARGYELGEYCLGGGYVVSRRLLDGLAEAGAYEDPLIWRELPMSEDLMMSVQCGAVGLKLYDVSQEGPRFAIDTRTITHSLAELERSSYSIIHSIKGTSEERYRDFFRTRRRQLATT